MYKLVDGTADYLPAECYNFFALSDKLMDSFVKRGFKRVDTPILERHELFSKPECGVNINNCFKLTDYDGALLVMRPDMTMPIARLATTKIPDASHAKFCYSAKSFRFDKGSSSALREFTQVGVEIFASSDAYVDADCIVMAIEGLKSAGLNEFQIEIGHVGYFKGLISALNLTKDEEKNVIELVNSKDKFGLELFIKKRNDNNKYWDRIANLPLEFGGVEMLKNIADNIDIAESLAAIDNLLKINDYIIKLGYGDYVSYDLSLVNGVQYYSGVVFKGITKYFGKSFLAGGRYDGLSKAFNKDLPATGFAIGVNYLLTAIRRESGAYFDTPVINALVGGSHSQAKRIKSIIDEMISRGETVENSYIDDIDTLRIRAKEINALSYVFVDEKGEVTNG